MNPDSHIRIEPATEVTFTFNLNGCANTLGPVTIQKSYGNDGKVFLNVSAYEVVDPLSERVDCALKTVELKTFIGRGFIQADDIELNFAEAPEKFALPKGTDTLRLVKGELAEVKVSQPPFAPGSGIIADPVAEATLVFRLNGCLNTLGPVAFTKTYGSDGKMKLDVAAYEVVNPKSNSVRCLAAPMKTAKIILGMGFYSKDNVEARFAEYLTSSAVTK
jgi:hypothetical protein